MEKSKTIVFIHGLFMNPQSWKEWENYFTQQGYIVHTPAYPYHEGTPAELRNNINPNLGKLTFGELVNRLANFIDSLPEKPVLIGHSMGGLAVQKLIAMNKGVAGVCISSAPPKGVASTKWSFLKSNFPVINPLKGNSVFVPSHKWFHYAFCNTLSRKESDSIYNKYAVPESRNIPRTSTKSDGKVNFKAPHAPLLFIAGAQDHIIPSSLNKKNYEKYADSGSKKSFREFAGKTHFICGQEGWQEVAEFSMDWLKSL